MHALNVEASKRQKSSNGNSIEKTAQDKENLANADGSGGVGIQMRKISSLQRSNGGGDHSPDYQQ